MGFFKRGEDIRTAKQSFIPLVPSGEKIVGTLGNALSNESPSTKEASASGLKSMMQLRGGRERHCRPLKNIQLREVSPRMMSYRSITAAIPMGSCSSLATRLSTRTTRP